MRLVQEIEIWPYEQMVYAQCIFCHVKWQAPSPLELWHTNESINFSQMTKIKQKKTCRIVDFAVLANNRLKLKENENKDKCCILT